MLRWNGALTGEPRTIILDDLANATRYTMATQYLQNHGRSVVLRQPGHVAQERAGLRLRGVPGRGPRDDRLGTAGGAKEW